jgi:PAS domain S-box-containing protein
MPRKKEKRLGTTPLVTKGVLILLQFLILLSLFQLAWQVVFPTAGGWSTSYLVMMGLLAMAVAFFILAKFQLVVEDFTLKSEKLERHVDERTRSLLKINEEMRFEISERKRVEAALNESESRFRAIISEAAIGIAIIGKNGELQETNPALRSMMGYSPVELQGIPFSRLLLPEDEAKIPEIFNNLLFGQQANVRTEQGFVRKDGTIGWGRLSVSLVRDISWAPKFFITLIEDVTEARLAEEKIRSYQAQLQAMASELSLSEERERRSLAGMLHDHIGQLLSMAKIKLEEIHDSAVYRKVVSPLKEVQAMIEKSINYTRSLIYELSPPILYDVGFAAAVEWLAEEMQQPQLSIRVEGDGRPDHLGNEVRHFLFRAVRELLFNVIKHAQASEARINIQRLQNNFQVSVTDNGVGFPEERLNLSVKETRGFGLFSIRERITYLGGSLRVESSPGQGARVILTLPMDHRKKSSRAG